MANQISILIPTHNRPGYLQRAVDYYETSNAVSEIIVADDGSEENRAKTRKFLSAVSNRGKIQYLDHYDENINFNEKLLDSLGYVSNVYCAISGDDDYLFPSSLVQCADFLDRNPGFACAHGYYITFYIVDGPLGRKRFVWKPRYNVKSIIDEDAVSRVQTHFYDYVPTFYATHRTDFLRDIFRDTIEHTEDLRFGEILPSMLTLASGKTKHLDLLYAARQDAVKNPGTTSDSFLGFIEDGTYEERYRSFERCLKAKLRESNDVSMTELENLIREGMDSIVGKYHERKEKLERKKQIVSFHPYALRLAKILYESFQSSYNYQNIKAKVSLISHPNSWRDRQFYLEIALNQNPSAALLSDVRSHSLNFN